MHGIEYDFLQCTHCEQYLHREFFTSHKRNASGKTSWCRRCASLRGKGLLPNKDFAPPIESNFLGVKEEWATYKKGPKKVYEASNYGRIRSKAKYTTRLLKPRFANGYLRIRPHEDGKQRVKMVHRCVAEAFLERPDWGEEVHHINHDSTDNRLVNLCWVTKKQNNFYRTEFDREQRAAAIVGRVVEPTPFVCRLFLAGVGSPEADGSPPPSGRSEQEQVPRPEVLPESVREVSWCVPFRQDLRFDSRPEHGYTSNSQARVGP